MRRQEGKRDNVEREREDRLSNAAGNELSLWVFCLLLCLGFASLSEISRSVNQIRWSPSEIKATCNWIESRCRETSRWERQRKKTEEKLTFHASRMSSSVIYCSKRAHIFLSSQFSLSLPFKCPDVLLLPPFFDVLLFSFPVLYSPSFTYHHWNWNDEYHSLCFVR